jgi:hypothetical protein
MTSSRWFSRTFGCSANRNSRSPNIGRLATPDANYLAPCRMRITVVILLIDRTWSAHSFTCRSTGSASKFSSRRWRRVDMASDIECRKLPVSYSEPEEVWPGTMCRDSCRGSRQTGLERRDPAPGQDHVGTFPGPGGCRFRDTAEAHLTGEPQALAQYYDVGDT